MSTEFYADYIKKTTFDPETHSVKSKLEEHHEKDENGKVIEHPIEEAATDVKKKPASKTPKMEIPPTVVPEEKDTHKTKDGRTAKKGLWYNIHQKRKRGEAPAKPGDPDRPSAADLKRSQESVAQEELHGKQYKLDHNKDNKIDKADMKMVRRNGAVDEKKKSLASLRNTSMLDGKDRLAKMNQPQKPKIKPLKTTYAAEGTFKVNVEGLPTMYIDGASAGEVKQALKKKFKDPKSVGEVERISPTEKKKELRAKVAEEDQVDEISGKTLASYAQGASSDMYGRALRKGMDIQRGSSDKDNDRKIKNRGSGIAKANMRMAGKMAKHNEDTESLQNEVEENYIVQKYSAGKKDGAPKSFGGNLKKATAHARKMGGDHRVHDAGNVAKHNEDTETVDELSRDTLGSYIQKASDASKHRGMPTKKVDNRYSGVAKASKKIDKMEEGIKDAVAKVKAVGSSMVSNYKKSRNIAAPGKGTNYLKGESVEEDNNYGPSHPLRKHLKKVGKGGEVEYSHQGKTHKGRYGGLMNRGGRSYAKVHHDTHMAMVPMPQVKYPD